MSIGSFPHAALRRAYGKQKRQGVANAAGQAILDFGKPPVGTAWVIHHVFVRGAAGQTVRLFVGGNPGAPVPAVSQDEVDSVTANPAVNGADEIDVDDDEIVWAVVTGVAAGTVVAGSIRYRIRSKDVGVF